MTEVLDKPTTSPISTHRHGDVLIVTSNNPPVNALGHAVRQGLVAAIEQAEADDAIKAVVIACEGPDLLRRRRRLGVRHAQGVRAADAAAGRRPHRGMRQAGGRGDPRHGARRRARGRARLPLSRRACRRPSSACPRSNWACCPGAGGTQRLPRVAGVGRRSKCARPARRSAPRRRSTAASSTG